MQNKKQKAMDNVLNEIAETVKLIESFQGKMSPSKENLDVIKADVELYGTLIDTINEFFEEFQPSEESAETDANSQFLLQAKEIELKGKMLQDAFFQASKRIKKKSKSESGVKDAASTQQMKDRKKLFKTIGGDKKWIPL